MKNKLIFAMTMLLGTLCGHVDQITSGGQTGVDRAALDVGLELHIPIGGRCPKGRLAEDGTIDLKYPMIETASSEYAERTLQNMINTDGTLILYYGELMGGTALTKELAESHHKPFLLIELQSHPDPKLVMEWIKNNHIKNLNIAGPRESTHPGVYKMAHAFLLQLFQNEEKE